MRKSTDSSQPRIGRISFDAASEQCPICAGAGLSRFSAHAHDGSREDRVSVVECKACAFAWQYPRQRTTDESATFFEHAYQALHQQDNQYFDPDNKSQVAKVEIDFVNSLASQGRALLDIGAGAGVFARVAQAQGWQVTAIDPVIDVAALAGAGVRAIKGSLDDLGKDALFDVVTLWDVIEHVDDPAGLMEAASRRVRPGGWLVVETGNYKCADRVYGGVTHWIYQLDHRWYFAPDSISALLTQTGCEEQVFADRVLRPGWQGQALYPGPGVKSLAREVMLRPVAAGAAMRRHAELRRASEWDLSGIPIFCVAGRVAA